MRTFVDTLKASACADRFIVEVTEDAFISKNQFQTQVLPMLREAGTRVSIDDFGTGYSSLSILADITADEIKIDRSFITRVHQRPRSQSVLKAIEFSQPALLRCPSSPRELSCSRSWHTCWVPRAFASPRVITLRSRSFSKRSSKRLALPEMSALFRSSGCGRSSRPAAAARAAATLRRN